MVNGNPAISYWHAGNVLKDDGLLAFTFHHKEPEAWAIVLKSVLDAGFAVSATYPVYAEMPISVHIHNQEAMAYDAVIFCRKRSEASCDSVARSGGQDCGND